MSESVYRDYTREKDRWRVFIEIHLTSSNRSDGEPVADAS